MSINLASYLNLYQYGVLARGALTSHGTGTGSTTVNNGYWYGSPINGSLVAGTPPSGLNSTISTAALNELNTLITDIITVTGGLNDGTVVSESNQTFSPGINYYSNTGITYTSKTLTFDAGNVPNPQFFITGYGPGITFTSVTFNLINGAQASNIFWLSNPPSGAGGFTVTTPVTAVPGIIITTSNGSTSSSTFTIPSSQNINGHIYSNTAITFNSTGNVVVNSTSEPVVCYAKGTLILTKRGFVPIENIKAGYKVLTKGKIHNNKFIRNDANIKIDPVVWISKFKVYHLNSDSRPICIKKNALKPNCPFKDLYVSPGHSLLLNGRMVKANEIVNGKTIYQDNECDSVEYYHLECENHSAILANGVLAESYLDVNNRYVFENSISLRRSPELKKAIQ